MYTTRLHRYAALRGRHWARESGQPELRAGRWRAGFAQRVLAQQSEAKRDPYDVPTLHWPLLSSRARDESSQSDVDDGYRRSRSRSPDADRYGQRVTGGSGAGTRRAAD